MKTRMQLKHVSKTVAVEQVAARLVFVAAINTAEPGWARSMRPRGNRAPGSGSGRSASPPPELLVHHYRLTLADRTATGCVRILDPNKAKTFIPRNTPLLFRREKKIGRLIFYHKKKPF